MLVAVTDSDTNPRCESLNEGIFRLNKTCAYYRNRIALIGSSRSLFETLRDFHRIFTPVVIHYRVNWQFLKQRAAGAAGMH